MRKFTYTYTANKIISSYIYSCSFYCDNDIISINAYIATNVTCQPIPVWGNIETDTSEVSPGESIEYRCIDGYVFTSGESSETITNTCDGETGAWANDFKWCEGKLFSTALLFS